MPVTLADIAELAGVSRMAVSESLRGVGRISGATRERIIRLATKKGYRPSASARAVRTGRCGSIALLASDIPCTALSGMLSDGVFDTLARHDLHLTVVRLTDGLLNDEAYIPRILREQACDGLLISSALKVPTRMADLIQRYHIPSIWMNLKRQCDCVYADDVAAARAATRKLIDLGHRNIAYADYRCGRDAEHYSAVDRQEGYEVEMKAAGLSPVILRGVDRDDTRIPPAEFRGGERLYHSLQWMSQRDRPTAVLAYGHETAVPIMLAAERLGIQLGAELAMISFENAPLAMMSLGCATMALRSEEMGRQAVEMLVEKIAHPRRRLPPQRVGYRLGMRDGYGKDAPAVSSYSERTPWDLSMVGHTAR